MSGRIAELSSPAHVSVRHRQLVMRREDGSAPSTSIEDLGLLVTDNPQITYTHAALAALAEAKVVTVLCGGDHMPLAAILPFSANLLSGERQRQQLACPKPLVKRLWQSVIAAKLRRQADTLRRATGEDAGLAAMAARVRSGDPDNLEAQGAQRYWPRLLGRTFRRDRAGDAPNHLLNYGYAILRAASARAIVSAGLLPGIGVFHSNRGDAFALASDLMEPFRPFTDAVVWEMSQAGLAGEPLDRVHKAHLLAVLNVAVAMDGQSLPLSMALHRTAVSLAASFASRRMVLKLPEGLAANPDDADVVTPAPA